MVLGKYSTCEEVFDEVCGLNRDNIYLSTSTTIVTGANTGIGKKAAQKIAYLGGRVILAVRSLEKGHAAVKDIISEAPKAVLHAGLAEKLLCLRLDLSSFQSVNDFVSEFQKRSQVEHWEPLRCLVLNAGIFSTGSLNHTAQGFEQVFGVNHLGHFLLTRQLLPSLRGNQPSRVVVVSSNAHRMKVDFDFSDHEAFMKHVVQPDKDNFGSMSSYGYSKLCNVLFAQELHAREAENGVAACSLHPGDLIATDIGRGNFMVNFFIKYIYSWFTKNVDQGASTTIYCSILPHEDLQGQYFDNCRLSPPSKSVQGEQGSQMSAELWRMSEELVSRAKL